MGTVSRGSLDPWFVTGLAQVAGSFTFSRAGTHLTPMFSMRMRDMDLLADLVRFFDAGALYERPDGGVFRVVRREDLDFVVQQFERHPLRGSQAKSFEVWREMVALKRESFRRPPLEKLNALAEKLRSSRR